MQLLERDAQLAQLVDLAQRAAGGEGGIALISGEAGIGKTALVDAFADRLLETQGPAVVRGTCDDLFTPRPLGPLRDIATEAHDAFGHLAQLTDDRETFFGAFLDRLRAKPFVIIIEDAHWADEATLDILCFAGRRIQSTRALLLLTYRDDELGPTHPLRRTLADFPRTATHRLPLPRLSELAVQTLARRAGRPGNGLYAVTNGNPFYVTEVLAAHSDAIPQTVRDAVLARAARLSNAAREILDVVSVVPGRTESRLLEAVLGEVGGAIEECRHAGMLQLGGGNVAFRHELARRAWEDALPAHTARAWHERVLAQLLTSADDVSARIVHHAARAGDARAVVAHAPGAAANAARLGAHQQAADLYGAVMPHLAALPLDQRAALLEAFANELHIVGRINEGIRALSDALEIWRQLGDRLREGDTLRQIGRLMWYHGSLDEALRLGAEAIAVLESLGPSAELAMAYSARSQAYMCVEEHEAAIEWGERAIAQARALGCADVVMHSLNNVGTSRLYRGEELGMQMLEESLRMAMAAGRHLDAGRALVNIAETLTCRRDFERAHPWEEAAIQFSREHDIDTYLMCVLGDRSHVHLVLGDWQRATEDAHTVLAHPRCPPVDRVPPLSVLGRMRARRGDPDIDAPLAEALAIARPTGEVLRMWPVTAARLEAAWLRAGDPQSVARTTAELALGRDVMQMAERVDNRWALGEVAFWSALLGGELPALERAAPPFRQALAGDFLGAAEAFAGLCMGYDEAIMLALSGEEAALRESFDKLLRLGARATIDRLSRELRSRGIARIPRGPAPRTRRHPALLTRKQVAVLELLAEGLSNQEIGSRLFISTKTAAHHVSAVLAKLDARSRAEAAARAREMGLLQAK